MRCSPPRTVPARAVLLLVGAAASCAVWAAPAAAEPPTRVLLTNDDGIAAPGLAAVRDALCRAGHKVTVVAPAANQSGSGGRITSGGRLPVTTSTFPCGSRTGVAWAVAGSPADTVFVAMDQLYRRARPDLVVSGSNAGQNLSETVNHSGTIGAALTASELGVPSIAVSTGLDPAQLSTGTPATDDAYGPTARTLAGLVDRLRRTSRGRRLLPTGVTLNLNYPVAPGADGRHVDARVRPLRFTSQWTGARFGLTYVRQPDGSLAIDLASALEPLSGAPRGTDDFAFARRHPTVTPIQGGASNPPEPVRRALRLRLAPLLR